MPIGPRNDVLCKDHGYREQKDYRGQLTHLLRSALIGKIYLALTYDDCFAREALGREVIQCSRRFGKCAIVSAWAWISEAR